TERKNARPGLTWQPDMDCALFAENIVACDQFFVDRRCRKEPLRRMISPKTHDIQTKNQLTASLQASSIRLSGSKLGYVLRVVFWTFRGSLCLESSNDAEVEWTAVLLGAVLWTGASSSAQLRSPKL